MNFFVKIFLLLGSLSLASSLTAKESWKQQLKLNKLPLKDRLMVLLASQIKSRRDEGFPQLTFQDLFDDEYDYLPMIDNFFIDARQLFTQSKKFDEDANLAEFDWGFRYTFCWITCIDEQLWYTTRDSKFIGTDTIKSSTKITPTTFENTFEIGLFNWTSPGFTFNWTDFVRETIWLDQNSFISFEKVTLAFNCDYHYVPDVGIQIFNLTIHLNPGKVRGWVKDITKWDFNGNLLATYEPEEYPYDDIMLDSWGYYKRRYTPSLQYNLNCFLSNGRSDPDNCKYDDGYRYIIEYSRLSNVELLLTLGLGELLSK